MADQIKKTERDVKAFLMDWKYYLKEIDKLKESLSFYQLKITVIYEESSFSGGSVSSTVERCVVKRDKLERELKKLLDMIEEYIVAINHCGLTNTEKEVIKCVMNRKKLIEYAEENGIYWTYVYKIKNRAVSKITGYINSPKSTKCKKKRVKC